MGGHCHTHGGDSYQDNSSILKIVYSKHQDTDICNSNLLKFQVSLNLTLKYCEVLTPKSHQVTGLGTEIKQKTMKLIEVTNNMDLTQLVTEYFTKTQRMHILLSTL